MQSLINNPRRHLAIIALVLFLVAMLVPFVIAALGRGDLAVGFGIVAGVLAMVFGALSRSERIGRLVLIIALGLIVFGVALIPIFRAVYASVLARERAKMERSRSDEMRRQPLDTQNEKYQHH